jgi:hypothetical protein
MLPKVMKRFVPENHLPHENDGKGMNIVQLCCSCPS